MKVSQIYVLCRPGDRIGKNCARGLEKEAGIKAEICNGNRTEWSPIRSVIIRVITKSDDRAAGVRFVYNELDDTKSYYQLIIKLQFPRKGKRAKLWEKGKICIKILTKEA